VLAVRLQAFASIGDVGTSTANGSENRLYENAPIV